jgi:Protein of unknown function (DUF664)
MQSDEQLRRPVLPSGWNCLGMVKHLALADEHYWFRTPTPSLRRPPSKPRPGSLTRMGEWGKRFTELRVVMLHMLKETALHAGHLDAAAELLDGRQWIVMPD